MNGGLGSIRQIGQRMFSFADQSARRAPGQNMSCLVLVMLASVTLSLVRSSMPVIVLPWPEKV